MTRNEIDIAKKSLCGWHNGVYTGLSREEKILKCELTIREFMLYCLAYNSNWCLDASDCSKLEYLGVKDGEKRVQELWREMKYDFENKGIVLYNYYTDTEGCAYNLILWSDEF